jgi:hypothetical protein
LRFFDHEGYNNGCKDYEKFVGLVKDLKEQISTPAGIKGIYDDLMARDLSQHNPMSLDVVKHSTSLMRELQVLTPDVVREQLREILLANNIVFFTSNQAQQLMELFAKREANSQTHLFTELGYKKNRFAWGGNKSQKACCHLPSAAPVRGEVLVGGIRAPIGQQINKVNELLVDPAMRNTEGHKDTSFSKNGQQQW